MNFLSRKSMRAGLSLLALLTFIHAAMALGDDKSSAKEAVYAQKKAENGAHPRRIVEFPKEYLVTGFSVSVVVGVLINQPSVAISGAVLGLANYSFEREGFNIVDGTTISARATPAYTEDTANVSKSSLSPKKRMYLQALAEQSVAFLADNSELAPEDLRAAFERLRVGFPEQTQGISDRELAEFVVKLAAVTG